VISINDQEQLCLNKKIGLEYKKLFQDAEKQIKILENYGFGLNIPAVNELRYVSYHFLGMFSHNDAEIIEDWKKIKGHIQRATYDACEATIFYNLHQYKKFKEDYELIVISEVIPNYLDLKNEADNIKDSINNIKRGEESRDAYYAVAIEYTNKIIEINAKLENAREELNKKMKLIRMKWYRWIVVISVPIVIAIVVSIIK